MSPSKKSDTPTAPPGPVSAESPPIWHSPKWITAIVAIITALLTIPEKVSDYLKGQQAIEKARVETMGTRIATLVDSTLQKKGDDRIFVLRFLAQALDARDKKISAWAAEEVKRIEKAIQLAADQRETEKALSQLETKFAALDAKNSAAAAKLNTQLEELRKQLEEKSAATDLANKQAGLGGPEIGSVIYSVRIDFDPAFVSDLGDSVIVHSARLSDKLAGRRCLISDASCEVKVSNSASVPRRVTIRWGPGIGEGVEVLRSVSLSTPLVDVSTALRGFKVVARCKKQEGRRSAVCAFKEEDALFLETAGQ